MWLYNGQRGGRLLGTAAEYIALDADLVSELPDNTSFVEGACLGIPCMTAHRAVTLAGDLAGKIVLVTGGAGAVGHYAVQWAKRFGARVITTVSSAEKAAHASAAGADLIVNYRSEDVVARIREYTGGGGVNHVVDVDFGGNLAVTLQVVAPNGSIAYYASRGNVAPVLPAPEIMRRNLAIHGILLNSVPHAARKRAQADIVQAAAHRWSIALRLRGLSAGANRRSACRSGVRAQERHGGGRLYERKRSRTVQWPERAVVELSPAKSGPLLRLK